MTNETLRYFEGRMAYAACSEGVQKDEGNYFESWNFPECCCRSQKCTEAETGAKAALSSSPEATSPEPHDSDFLPSVFLAAALALLFIFVSVLLLHRDSHPIHLGDCRAVSPGIAPLLENNLKALHLFLPNTLETTQQTLQRYRRGQPGGTPHNGIGILAAVEPRDAINTLLCPIKVTRSFLTEECAMKVQLPDQGSSWDPWMDFLENWICDISATEICSGGDLEPSLMVSWEHSFGEKRVSGQNQPCVVVQWYTASLGGVPPPSLNAHVSVRKLTLTTNKSLLVFLV